MAKPKAEAGFAAAHGSANYEWDAENPACVSCGSAMFLLDGCEWHDDPTMNLCHQCALGALTDARNAIEEIRQVATGEKQVANDDTEGMDWIAKRIAALKPNAPGEPRRKENHE